VKERWIIVDGQLSRIPDRATMLAGVHPRGECIGKHCVIHNPSDHHMSHLPLHWRDDRGIFERICQHGIGHPDPDQREAWKELLPPLDAAAQQIHACDGCCRER
jgi:hypothetical protein